MKQTTVTVFGNELEVQDRIAIQLLPHLKPLFPLVTFIQADPTESLEPQSEPWIILDAAIGITKPMVIHDLNDLEYVKGQSVHDFDVYMELRLRKKIGQIGKVAILLVPNNWTVEQAMPDVTHLLQHELDQDH